MRRFLVLFIMFLAPGVAAAADPCGWPAGLYEGTTTTPDGSNTFEVTLNLYCDGTRLAGQFFTSIGDFPAGSVEVARDSLKVGFKAFGAPATLDLSRSGDGLAGVLDLEGGKGTASFVRKGPALAADALTPRLDLTPAQWHADVAFLARELPRRHANIYFSLSKEKFAAEVAALDRRADTANGDEMLVGLQQLAKSIGDGHTGVSPPADRRDMPVEIARFGKDFRITAATAGYARAIGTRIVKIGGVPVATAWQRVLTLTPRDELMQLRESAALVYLARGYVLHGLGITTDRSHARYTLRDDAGKTFDLDIAGLGPDQHPAMRSGYSATALRRQDPDNPFWCRSLPEQRAVYCAWRGYDGLKDKAREMWVLTAKSAPGRLIIDMRDNGGGDNTVGDAQLVKPIRASADLNRRGHLYILIGPDTFSAAMNNAAQFQDETSAILVGDTIGEKPNSYQEPRQFRLPNSHLIVRASTLWYAFRKKGPNVVAPEKRIVPTWSDVKAGRDPVLDWVLAQP